MARLPLEEIRIADFGQVVAIPYCTQILGWMGAEVINVETDRRMTTRASPPYFQAVQGVNRSGIFNIVHCNTKSCNINLKDPAGIKLAHRLIALSDVVTENYSTGTMEKLGLDFETVRRIKPDIIYLSMGAFGRTGPMADLAGYHSVSNSFSGVAAVTGYPGGRPRILGSLVPDTTSGLYGALAVLEALYYRRRTGKGQFIDIAMNECMTTLIPEAVADYSMNGREAERVGNKDKVKAPHDVFRCQGHDKWIAISVGCDEEWQNLCQAIGRPDLVGDPRFADRLSRWHHQDELRPVIEAWTSLRDRYEAMGSLQDAGVTAAPTLDSAEIMRDPHAVARETVAPVDHPEVGSLPQLTVSWRMDSFPGFPRLQSAPLLGEHTREVLSGVLGLSEHEIARLAADKVIRVEVLSGPPYSGR